MSHINEDAVYCDIILTEKKNKKKYFFLNKTYNYFLFIFIQVNFIFTSSWRGYFKGDGLNK